MIALYLLLIGAGWLLGSANMLMFLWLRVENARVNIASQTLFLRQELAAEKARKAGRLEVVIRQQRSNGAVAGSRVLFFDALDQGVAREVLSRAFYLEQRGAGFSTRNLSDVLSRHQFEAFRDELINRELLAWGGDDPRAGVVWTETGHAVIQTAALEV